MKPAVKLNAWILAFSVVALAAAADAAVLHTPPLTGGLPIICEIKNIGKKPAEVTIENILTGGTLHISKLTKTIAPEVSAFLSFSGSASVCRFTVTGSKRNFVASGCVSGGGCLEAR